MSKFYTIGYGGRAPEEFLQLLTEHGVRMLVDVRLRPDRASMGIYTLAKDPEKGIRGLLAKAGIGYVSLLELGNPFFEMDDWESRYARLFESAGELLTERLLAGIEKPFCLMCSEKSVEECHRKFIAAYLERRGGEAEHIA
jgi:uncharacterized protein (DUF488 family)